MQKNKDVIEIDVVEVFLFMLRRWWMFILSMVLVLEVAPGGAPEGAYAKAWSINGVDATLSVRRP